MVSKSSQIVLLAAGAVLAGGALYVLRRRPEEPEAELDDVAFSKVREASFDVSSILTREATTYEPVSASQPVADSEDGVAVFNSLGLVLKPENGWKVNEEVSPLPNVALLSLQHEKYAHLSEQQMMPGQIPVLMLSVEDISLEGLDAYEFKEKTKMMAIQQTQAMTGGMLMPQFTKDGKTDMGPFKMCLKYEMNTPYMQMTVLNLIAVENNLAYTLQYMGQPSVFHGHEAEINSMAKSMEITKLPFRGPPSVTTVASKAAGVSVGVPVLWILESMSSGRIELMTPSPTKPEKIEILNNSSVFSKEELEALCKKAGGSAMKISEMDGVFVMKYKNSVSHDVTVMAKDKFAVRVTPERVSKSIIAEKELLLVVKSIKAHSEEDSLQYNNFGYKFSFPVLQKSRLVEARIGDTAVTYAPEGISMDPSEEAKPLLTIRVGDPSTDPECESSLEGWMKRMKAEADANISDLRFETFNDHRCVSFTQVEMQETGPGSSEEHKAKIIVFVEAGKSYLLRWDTPTGTWRKFEKQLYRLLDGLSFAL